jgi:hypothetical protein
MHTPHLTTLIPPPDTRAVDGGNVSKPGEKGAQLLVMLNEVAKAAPAEAALLKSVSSIFR